METTWNAKTDKLIGDELIVLYSDGVVPLRATVSSWAAQIKRKVIAGQVSVAEMLLVGQIRQNKTGFRASPDLVDDMTLVMVRRNPASLPQAQLSPENSQTSAPAEIPHSA